ncbi:hypothetical protein BGW42_005688 [Actinomortierella wolfii]|nr:hypothetical protein BGW42_005688 [Actinomortierella wolfii]
MSKSTSKAKGDSVGARDSMEKKEAKYKGKEKSSKKTRSKNQQDSSGRKTKTREERKQDQLIPVVDENGVVIEDHFISPRDLDGDGSPDTYVLLRPTDNSKDMLDVGLFDEDVAAVAAVAPAEQKLSSTTLPTPSSSPSHTPILQPPAVVVVPGGQPKPSLEPSATGQPQPDPQPSDLATPSSSPMPESTHDLKVEPDNNAQGPNS